MGDVPPGGGRAGEIPGTACGTGLPAPGAAAHSAAIPVERPGSMGTSGPGHQQPQRNGGNPAQPDSPPPEAA